MGCIYVKIKYHLKAKRETSYRHLEAFGLHDVSFKALNVQK